MSILTRLRFLDAGESHGPILTAIIEGIPAGFAVDSNDIDAQLERRQRGLGSSRRMKIEKDRVKLTAGVMAGRTTGSPIALEIPNLDFKNWRDKKIKPMVTPRPGHADLTGAIKFAHRDLRLSLERASARETAMRVAAGAICKLILAEFAVEVGGYVTRIGSADSTLTADPTPDEYRRRFEAANESAVCCPDAQAQQEMGAAIDAARVGKDTLGGIFEIVALGLPPGLGSYTHWDRRLEARLAMVLTSIPAIKGVEIGPAFENARSTGTAVHDQIITGDSGQLVRGSNRAGGFEGGITTGEPVVLRAAMKPISTTLQPGQSVNLATFEHQEATYERSDICAVPRAVPIGEAMVAIALTDALLEKLGGDSLQEMRPRFERLARGVRKDFVMNNESWQFDYDE